MPIDVLTDPLARWDPKSQEIAYNNFTDRMKIELPARADPAASGVVSIISASGTDSIPVYLTAPIPVAVIVDIETDAIKIFSASGTNDIPVYLTNRSELDVHTDKGDDSVTSWVVSSSGTPNIPVYLTAPLEIDVHLDEADDTVRVYSASGSKTLDVHLTDVAFEEDRHHVSGDRGVPSLAVRNDSIGSLAGTDGDYANLQLNAYGSLRTQLDMVRDVSVAIGNGYADTGTIRVAVASGVLHYANDSVTEVNSADIKLHTENINTDADILASAVYADNFHWTDNVSKNYLVGGVFDAANTITAAGIGPIAINASGAVLIADGGNSITIDSSVLDSSEVHLGNINSDADTVASAIYEDNFHWSDNTSKGILIQGTYLPNHVITGTAVGPINIDSSGAVNINDGGNSITVDVLSASGTPNIPVYLTSPLEIDVHLDQSDDTVRIYSASGTTSIPVYVADEPLDVLETNPAVLRTTEYTWAQLTAPGNTPSLYVISNSKHTFQYKVANINTSLKVAASGSLDNTDWFNLDANDALTQHTSNGTFGMVFDGKIKYTLFSLIEEVGGTDVTVDAKYLGGN